MPPVHSDPPSQSPPPPSGQPDRRALLEAYQDVVRATRVRRPPRRAPVKDRAPFWISTGVTILALTALLVFRPSWFFTRPPSEPPQVQEASLRIRMFVEIDRVLRYRVAHGRLPTTLAEAGGDSTGVTYERRGEGFIVLGTNGDIQLRYHSSEPAEAFLGNSYQVVRDRARERQQ